MKTLTVIEVVGSPVLLSQDKGNLLKAAMKTALQSSPHIVVDFAGYQFLSTMFLNFSFGSLCLEKDWSEDEFSTAIEVRNLEESDRDDLRLSLYNAQKRRELRRDNIDVVKFYEDNVYEDNSNVMA
jgi:hypothetical protein